MKEARSARCLVSLWLASGWCFGHAVFSAAPRGLGSCAREYFRRLLRAFCQDGTRVDPLFLLTDALGFSSPRPRPILL